MAFGEISCLTGHRRWSQAGRIASSCQLREPITAQDLIDLFFFFLELCNLLQDEHLHYLQ